MYAMADGNQNGYPSVQAVPENLASASINPIPFPIK